MDGGSLAERTLESSNLKKPAPGTKVEEQKSHVLTVKAKQQSLDELNACLVEEAKAAKNDVVDIAQA